MIPGYTFSKKANPIVGYGSPIAGEFAAAHKLVKKIQADKAAKAAQAARQQEELYRQLDLGGLGNIAKKYGIPIRIVPMANTSYVNMRYRNDINGVIEVGGDPLDNMNKLVNPTNNPKVRANLEMQDRERQKARAQAFGVPYEPGKRYFFNYNIPGLNIPTYKLPSIFDTGKPATYLIIPGIRAYADSSHLNIPGAMSPTASLKTFVHEAFAGVGHRGTHGAVSNEAKIFTSAKHGDEGSQAFVRNRPGSEPPHSYFNSMPEHAGLSNRMKIVSGASDTPFTFIEFNRGDPGYKIKPNEAGGYNVMDWLELQGIVSWNPKTMQYDYTKKWRLSTIPQQELYKIHKDSASLGHAKRREARKNLSDAEYAIWSLAPPAEVNAFLQQVNRVYYLQEKARNGTITKDEAEELDRATKILKHNIRLSDNRMTPSVPGYTYNQSAIG